MKFDKVEFIYNSNAIENHFFPKGEIKKAVDSGKSSNPHIMGHLKALWYADCAAQNTHPITPQTILVIHTTLMYKIMKSEETGKFRKSDVTVGPHTPPNWQKLTPLVNDLLYAINTKKDPWLCHCEFECIHPFVDGNGRTGRVLLYMQERAQGIEPRIILEKGKQPNYYNLLQEYETRKRPELWQIKIWRKILKRNETLLCKSCGTTHNKMVEKCTVCARIDSFVIQSEVMPFGEQVII